MRAPNKFRPQLSISRFLEQSRFRASSPCSSHPPLIRQAGDTRHLEPEPPGFPHLVINPDSGCGIEGRYRRWMTRGHKKTPKQSLRGFSIKAWQFPTFAWKTSTLSSALSGFTSEFEMGSGGTHSLWSPDKSVGHQKYPHRYLRSPGRSTSCLIRKIVHSHMAFTHAKNLGVIWSSLTGN